MKEFKPLECEIRRSGEKISTEETHIRLAKYVCMLAQWDANPPEALKGKNIKKTLA